MSYKVDRIPYRDPRSGGIANTSATFDIEGGITPEGNTLGVVIRSGLGYQIDISREARTALYGKLLSPPDGLGRAFLSTAFTTGTTLTVYNSGTVEADFAADDIVAIVEDYSQTTSVATKVRYRRVASRTASTIVVDSDPGTSFSIGSMVCNMAGLEDVFWKTLSFYEGIGVKAAYERPPAPTWTASTPSAATIRVTINNPNIVAGDNVKAYFDVYARAEPWTYPHPSWTPDDEDVSLSADAQDDATMQTDITTVGGGANCVGDPGGSPTDASMNSDTVYYVGVVRKDRSGNRQTVIPNESVAVIKRVLTT